MIPVYGAASPEGFNQSESESRLLGINVQLERRSMSCRAPPLHTGGNREKDVYEGGMSKGMATCWPEVVQVVAESILEV